MPAMLAGTVRAPLFSRPTFTDPTGGCPDVGRVGGVGLVAQITKSTWSNRSATPRWPGAGDVDLGRHGQV